MRTIALARAQAGEIFKLAIWAGLIIVFVIAMFMGVGNVQETLKSVTTARAQASVNVDVAATVTATLKSSNLYVLPSPIPTQIPVPGILEPAK